MFPCGAERPLHLTKAEPGYRSSSDRSCEVTCLSWGSAVIVLNLEALFVWFAGNLLLFARLVALPQV